jgi:hypothetical protein
LWNVTRSFVGPVVDFKKDFDKHIGKNDVLWSYRRYQIAYHHVVKLGSTGANNFLNVRVSPSADSLLLTPDPFRKMDSPSRSLQTYYGIGTSNNTETNGNAQRSKQVRSARLPIVTGLFDSKSTQDDMTYNIGSESSDGRQSDIINAQCLVPFDECCENKDCLFIRDICVHHHCIDDGSLRITLKWVGDDDLDLFVLTPEGAEISYNRIFDPVTLGRFGEAPDQLGSGFHVENVYFPIEGAPAGRYTFFVRPLIVIEGSDFWTIDVVEGGSVVLTNSGDRASPEFSYLRKAQAQTPNVSTKTPTDSPNKPPLETPKLSSTQPTLQPNQSPVGPSASPPQSDDGCSLFSHECCVDNDCEDPTRMCIQRTCTSDGNPRITLIWEGDSDLNLFVRTPSGVEISAESTFDKSSRGRFERDVDQSFVGPHFESVYFPLLGSPTGNYEYGLKSISQNDATDVWLIEVYEGGQLVATKSSSGGSVSFTYLRSDGIVGPERPQPKPPECNPTQDDCCLDSDCATSQLCVQRLCVEEGSLRVSLEWVGDDDYDLFVETPSGAVISRDTNHDPQSGGRLGETPPQAAFGFQLEYVFFPTSGAPVGTYHCFVESISTRGIGADVWKVQIYEFGNLVQEESGIGDSRRYTYQRVFLPTPPAMFPISSSPFPSPALPTNPPIRAGPPSRVCPAKFECCDSIDCVDPSLRCIQRTCLKNGEFVVDLTWTGNDSLNLVVITPLQDAISIQNPFDQKSGGLHQNDPYQPDFGFHIERVVFPSGPQSGSYSFFVKSRMTVGDEDRWTLKVYDSNQLTTFEVGTGDSRSFSFNYEQGDSESTPFPVTPPEQAPLPPSTLPEECGSNFCETEAEVCIQGTCTTEGNPRLTLQWTGNDDLGLVVVTPNGIVISADFPFDPVSGGRLAQTDTQKDDEMQAGFGKHHETIFFPLSGGPVGAYRYYVTMPLVQGSDDSWIVSVAVGGVDVELQQGSGMSDAFTFSYLGEVDSPGPQPGECRSSSDCSSSQICIVQICVEQGTPQFILSYAGDDDLDLYVITPIETIIYSQNRDDVPSGGKFGDNGKGNGVQDIPGTHIEYVVFAPNVGPIGIYQYYVETFRSTDEDDPWTITVFVSDQEVSLESGQGSSDIFVFDFNSTTLAPSTLPSSEEFCDTSKVECCLESTCFPNEACTFTTCVDEGNPRFTLGWEGGNDLDLLVQTPLDTVISFSNVEDPESGGKFGEEFDQFGFGRHVENIYFPVAGGPTGEYSIYVRSFLSDGKNDKYTIRVFVNGLEEVAFNGTGDSDRLTYVFQGLPTANATESPSPRPLADSFPTEPPQVGDCFLEVDECCSDLQCVAQIEVCTQRTCIDIGLLRFTLEWVGDDDLDLVVQTPVDTVVSFPTPIDEETGGVFGEGGTQVVFGNHVENVYFLSPSIPSGRYQYNVSSFESRGSNHDDWSVSVFLNNELVDVYNGTGDSETFVFQLKKEDINVPPTDPDCNLSVVECCVDQDCDNSQACTLDICINVGLPRFTLEYVGDDQIDLTVVTPIGTTVSSSNPVDGASTGRFEDGGEKQIVGKRVQNVYFSDGPSGTYTYFISTFDLNGEPDEWTIKVVDGDIETMSFAGSGNADFLYDFDSSSVPPETGNVSGSAIPSQMFATSPPANICQTPDFECCDDGDCAVGDVCRSRTCISDGNPRFTVTWMGSDDYDLTVTAPTGGTISILNQFDQESGGRFGENEVQVFDGVQIESVYFALAGGPEGTYTAEITLSNEARSSNPATWALEISVVGEVVERQFGTGSSGPIRFEYENESNVTATSVSNAVCVAMEDVEGFCCDDSNCVSDRTICVSKSCIQVGRLRFTLTWNGDGNLADDLDLVVVTPDGMTLQNDRSQGDHVPQVSYSYQKRSSHNFAHQVENVSFPGDPPVGLYQFQIIPFITLGDEDPWVLQIYVDGHAASELYTGNGSSEVLSFEFKETDRDKYMGANESGEQSTGMDIFQLDDILGEGNADAGKAP